MNYFWEQAKKVIKNRKPIKEVEDKLPKLPTIRKEEEFKEMKYDFKNIRGHVEVFANGEFQYSADTMREAHEMLLSEDL